MAFTLHRRGVLDPQRPRLLKRTTVKLSPEQHIVPPTREPEACISMTDKVIKTDAEWREMLLA